MIVSKKLQKCPFKVINQLIRRVKTIWMVHFSGFSYGSYMKNKSSSLKLKLKTDNLPRDQFHNVIETVQSYNSCEVT